MSLGSDQIAADFQRGTESAKRATVDRKASPDSIRTTEKESAWFADTCANCRHTFREGDQVLVGEDGKVVHHDERLGCPDNIVRTAPPTDPRIVLDFLEGAISVWAEAERKYMLVLDEDHPLVAMPAPQFRRPRCIVCGQTLRAGEIILLCPCAAHEQRPNHNCQIAVHYDPLHGIYCYGDWRPRQYDLHCPSTLRKIGG